MDVYEVLSTCRYVLVHSNNGAIIELFKTTGEPCITVIDSSAELLVSKGNVGIFVGADGRVSRKAGLTWSDAPAAVAYSQPYAVALLPNYVEIRSLQRVSPHGLAQARLDPALAAKRIMFASIQLVNAAVGIMLHTARKCGKMQITSRDSAYGMAAICYSRLP